MLDAFHHFFVGDDLLEALRRQLLEEHHGVFTGSAPKLHIEVVEDCLGFAVPNPPKIFGDLFKRLEFRGEVGFHCNVTPDGDISVADLKFHVVRWCIVLCDCFYIDECNLSLRHLLSDRVSHGVARHAACLRPRAPYGRHRHNR